jgi:hypothetical protein
MSKRLTRPMRQVLKNLIDGKPANDGVVEHGMRFDPTPTVLTCLRKRGYVAMARDTSHYITPQGREALTAHERATN